MAWNQQQLANAHTIIQVGLKMGMSNRDIQIALMTAMQESSLQNLSYGMGSSVGLFQQISSWGSFAQRHNPVWSSTAFFNALKGVTDRDQMSLTEAAQAVQRSAYPDAYAKWADDAASILGNKGGFGAPTQGMGGFDTGVPDTPDTAQEVRQALGQPATLLTGTPLPDPQMAPVAPLTDSLQTPGVAEYGVPDNVGEINALKMPTIPDMGAPGSPVAPQGGSGSVAAGWAGKVIAMAEKYIGTPYVWGGSSPNGFDCSGLIQYVFQHALGVNLPRVSFEQANYGKHISLSELQPGDLVGWDFNSRNNGADHIALYIGNGRIIEAPRPGMSVHISKLYDQDRAWGVRMRF